MFKLGSLYLNILYTCYEGGVLKTTNCDLLEIQKKDICTIHLSLPDILDCRARNIANMTTASSTKMAVTPPMTPMTIGRVLVDVSWVVSDVGSSVDTGATSDVASPVGTGVSLGVMAGGRVRDTGSLVVAVGGRL